ncbi:MAG: DUF1667 domain-containing protein [Clostridia bacterium]|nr:DUF1667 domain-containing protein [Clostridia bacterium]
MNTEKNEFVCIVCPEGCSISAVREKDGIKLSGNKCKRGEEYVKQEITDPRRNISSSVLVCNGVRPLVPVKTASPIPKNKIYEVMEEIKKAKVNAPIYAGQVIISDAAQTDVCIVATADVAEK